MSTFATTDSTSVADLLVNTFSDLIRDYRILPFVAAALFGVAGSSSVWAQQPGESKPVQVPQDLSQPNATEQIPQPSSRDADDPKSSVASELELLKQRIEELEGAKLAHEKATETLNQRIEELETAKVAHERATRALNQRLEELEAVEVVRQDATVTLNQRLEELETAKVAPADAARVETTRKLDQRIEELEKAKVAQEDATRQIIRQSFAERGSSINDYVDFSGTLEALAFRTEDFAGVDESNILFDTADLDFKIKVSDWVLGSLILSHDPGTDTAFPTTTGDEAFVDRINVREGLITLGNTERFPFFAKVGRADVPFGISTGDPVTDTLTLISPLTVEAFETREDFVMLGFEGPTPPPPPPLPATPAPSPPPVRPLLFGPLAHKFSKLVCASLPCYPPPPKPAAPVLPPTPVPPVNAAFYLYNGDTIEGSEDHIEHVGATLGYKTKGMLSRRNIPWSIDMDIDFNSSVFDSNFLAFQHRPFLTQIGYVPGMAAHVKSSFGPAALMLEWNGAIDDATFTDEALELDPDSGALNVVPGRRISIEPSAWQIQFAYQFDFNPSVEAIGAQGTYFVIGYSESEDLAGVTRVVVDPRDPSTLTPTRVGFVPERRFSVGLGEWIWPSLRLALEYSYEWDYSRTEGGSGRSADGFFGQLTYEW